MPVRSLCALITLLLFLLAFSFPSEAAESKTRVEAITSVLQLQADSWNRGDLDAFMSGYLKSADTSYTSGGTIVWGYEALRQRYQTKYGSSRETMGKLKFSDLKCFELGAANELVIGHWHLELQSSTIDGVFSLVLVKTDEGWKIMHDHTSTMKPISN